MQSFKLLIILAICCLTVSNHLHAINSKDKTNGGIEAPEKPTGLAVYGIGGSTLTITWNPVSGATNYKVYVTDDDGWSRSVYPTNTNYKATGYEDNDSRYINIYVHSEDASGLSTATSILDLDLETASVPSTPSGLSLSSVTATSFNASWNSISGANAYIVEVSTSSGFSSWVSGYDHKQVTSTSTTISGLVSGTTYYFRVRAVKDGIGSNATTQYATTLYDLEIPGGIKATPQSTSFTVSWNSVSGASSYEVYASEDSDGWSRTESTSGTSITFSDVNDRNDIFTYKVRALNGDKKSEWSSYYEVELLPPAPTILSASTITSSSFVANWTSTGASRYELDVSLDENFSSYVSAGDGKYFENYQITGTSWEIGTVVSLQFSATYYYRVRAYYSGEYSSESEVGSIKLLPEAPKVLAPSEIKSGTFFANWTETNSGVIYYELDVSKYDDFHEYIYAFDGEDYEDFYVSGTSWEVGYSSSLNPSTTYYYRVRAVYANSYSSESEEVMSVTTTPNIPDEVISSSTSSSFTISWGAAEGATSYEIEAWKDAGGWSESLELSNRSYTFEIDDSWNETFSYRLRSLNGDNKSAWTGTYQVKILPEVPQMKIPTEVTSGAFLASWSSTNATWYELDVSKDQDFSSAASAIEGERYENYIIEEGTSWMVGLGNLLDPNTKYYVRVRAYYSAYGYSSESAYVEVTTPEPPMVLKPTEVTSTSFIANWELVEDADYYRLDVSTDPDFLTYITDGSLLMDSRVEGTSLKIGQSISLNPNTNYYYRIRVYYTSIFNSVTLSSMDLYSHKSIDIMTATTLLDNDKNYVLTEEPRAGMNTKEELKRSTEEYKSAKYEFYDDLGRLDQVAQWRLSPNLDNLISGVSYDEFGRKVKQYLPYPSQKYYDDAFTIKQNSFYDSFYEGGNEGAYAYTITQYESSPLNRVLYEYSPGSGWSNKPVSRQYSLNDQNEEVIFWNYSDLLNQDIEYHGLGQLYKNVVIDEDGNEVFEYSDKQGKTRLKKSLADESAETYYIYDDFDQLRVVLPPQAVNLLVSDFFGKSETIRQDFLDNWAFQYEYDYRQRMITKKVPGADPVYMIYDKWDRLVLTQDGNQRLNDEWVFTKYDIFNRPIMTGIAISDGFDRGELETMAMESEERYEIKSSVTEHGYTVGNSFPFFVTEGDFIDDEVLSVTYYDDYDFLTLLSIGDTDYVAPSEFSGSNVDDFHLLPTKASGVKGQVTGTKMRILETEDYLETITYYDSKYRVIQVISENEVGGTDVISSQYDFVGNVRRVKSVHTDDAIGETTVLLEYDYDHANRLLSCDHQLNDSPKVRLYTNEYNELGELIDKKLHSTDNGSSYAQAIDYEYNIRGWLTKINEASVGGTTESPEITLPDVFGMELYYEMTPDFN